MIKKVLITTICTLALNTLANSNKIKEPSETDKVQYQNIIDDYQKYSNAIPSKLKEEVINYLQDINKIEKTQREQKRELYKKLSEDAQGFINKEREYRKKLPFYMKKKISLIVKEQKQESDTSDAKDKN